MSKTKWRFWRTGLFPANLRILKAVQIALIGWIKAGPLTRPLFSWKIGHVNRLMSTLRHYTSKETKMPKWPAVRYKGVSRKKFRGGGAIKDREIAPMWLLHFISGRLEGALSHALRAHLKRTLHQKPCCVKSENFFRQTPISAKMTTIWKNFRPFSYEKTLYPGPQLDLSPLPFNVNQNSKNYDVWWELGCFYKTSAWWKTLVVSCVKIRGGTALSQFLAPSANVYGQIQYCNCKFGSH